MVRHNRTLFFVLSPHPSYFILLTSLPLPERFYWQACALNLSGLPVKTSRPERFTPSAGRSGWGVLMAEIRSMKYGFACLSEFVKKYVTKVK